MNRDFGQIFSPIPGGQNGDVKKNGLPYINDDELPDMDDVFRQKNYEKMCLPPPRVQ